MGQRMVKGVEKRLFKNFARYGSLSLKILPQCSKRPSTIIKKQNAVVATNALECSALFISIFIIIRSNPSLVSIPADNEPKSQE